MLTNITVAVPQDPGILAFDAIGIGTYTFTRLLWAGLFRIRANTRSLSEVDPDAAMSWTISPDASVYTFHLRPGIKFSDGSPLTSVDVKASIEIEQKPQYGDSVFISEIKEVDTPDPQTVVIRLSHGDSTFWPLMSEIIDIVPAAAVQRVGEASFQQDPTVTSGPYELVKYTKNQEVTLKRNPNYWGKKPPFDTITLKIVPDASSRMEQLLSHAIDAAPIDVAQISQLSSTLHLVIGAPATAEYIGLRFDQAPTNNVLVRQAMNYAIDREALVHTFEQGHAALDNSALAPSMVGATTMAPYTYDPAKARQLLAQYGKPVSFKFDVASSQVNN
ncbi:MAG: ABC transporter substrate-binding protein, partial [Acidimicrobiales bacterium]